MHKSIFLLLQVFLLPFGIIRGDVDKAKYVELSHDPAFDCVGLVWEGTKPVGSCVFIGGRYVLSATHVFKGAGELLKGAKDFIFELKGRKYRGDSLYYRSDPVSGRSYDLALIRLDEAPADVQSHPLNDHYDEKGSVMTGVGFGASGIADKPAGVRLTNEKIAGENMIDSIGGERYNGIPVKMFCDFDSPTDKTCNKMGDATPLPLEYILSGGDSGGGVFRKVNGSFEVIGICSGMQLDTDQLLKTGYYGQIMYLTRVSVFANWIRQVMAGN